MLNQKVFFSPFLPFPIKWEKKIDKRRGGEGVKTCFNSIIATTVLDPFMTWLEIMDSESFESILVRKGVTAQFNSHIV